jgi:hypothetical protein
MPFPLSKWYYNSHTGAVEELPEAIGFVELHSGLGWHGPFDTKQAALDFYNTNKAANPGWAAPTGIGGNLANAGAAVVAPITDVTGAITGATNTIVKLVPRVLEAAAGIVLLAIAANVILKQVTGVDVAGSAVRATRRSATTAAKAAAVA